MFSFSAFWRRSGIRSQPGREPGFVDGSGGESENGLSCVLFLGGKEIIVDFKKEYANDETGTLIAIDKRMVTHYADDVSRSQVDHVRGFSIGMNLTRTGQRRIKQCGIAQAGC